MNVAPSAAQALPADRMLRLAGRALAGVGLPEEDHVIMRENVASYMTHLDPQFCRELEGESPDRVARELRGAWTRGEHRWVEKLRRDLDQPYTDQETVRHARDLDGQLQDRLAELRAWPCQVYVTGSLLKGRFGGNSDVDLVCEVAPGAPRPQPMPGQVCVQVCGEGDGTRQAFGESRPLGQDKPVETLLRQGLEARGYEVRVEPSGEWHIAGEGPAERSREVSPPSSMIWSFADLPA